MLPVTYCVWRAALAAVFGATNVNVVATRVLFGVDPGVGVVSGVR
jgi:hypothetical protein